MAAQVTGVSNPPLKSLNKIFTIIVTYLQKPEKKGDQKEEKEKKRERVKEREILMIFLIQRVQVWS